MALKTLEQSLFEHLLAYEAEIAGQSGNPLGPNIEDAMGRDRNLDPEFASLLQMLQDRGFIDRNADCHYRLTDAGRAYSKRL